MNLVSMGDYSPFSLLPENGQSYDNDMYLNESQRGELVR